jgi:hypothetical protein
VPKLPVHCGTPPQSPFFHARVLVAFDTGRGIIYARTSGWQRVYLLWTFRNFRSPPQKILNPRQQGLVATLYRTSAIDRSREFDDGVIGTVEEFRLPSSASDRSANQRIAPDSSERNLADAHSLPPGEPGEQFYSRRAFSRMTLRIGAGALLILVAAFVWYQIGAQPAFIAGKTDVRTTERAVPAPQAADAGNARAESMGSQNVEPPAARRPVAIQAANAQPSTMAWLRPAPAPAGPSGQSARASSLVSREAAPRAKAVAVLHVPLGPHGLIPAPADQRLSGPPRKLVYPVCPDRRAGQGFASSGN